jgi:hypothetical protein
MAVLGLAGMLPTIAAHADNFVRVYYSASRDQLVITMSYRGTNPDHAFSVKWDECKKSASGNLEIGGEILDSQWRDVEQRDFQKTTRISLVNLKCRPATLTLRTAPRFMYTLQIPARTSSQS